MAFYTHYQGGLISHKGILYNLLIDGRYPQESIEQIVITTEEPIVLERSGDGDLFAPIRTLSAQINILSERAGQYAHLLTSPPQSYRVTISRGSEIVFIGWVESGLSEEAYARPPYEVTITATDGLAALQDYPCLLPWAEDFSGKMFISVFDMIKYCLQTTGDHVSLSNISVISRIATENLSLLYIDARAMLFDEQGRRTDETAYDTLASILSSLGMRVYQHRGSWVMDRPADLIYPFAYDASLLDLSTLLIDTEDRYFISDASYSIVPAYGSLVVNLNTDKRETILRSTLDSGIVNSPIVFDAAYDVWRHTGFQPTNQWICKTVRTGGYNISIEPDPTPGTIRRKYPDTFFFARFPVTPTMKKNIYAEKIKITFKMGYINGQSDHDVYVNMRVLLLQGSTPLYVASYLRMVSYPFAQHAIPVYQKEKHFEPEHPIYGSVRDATLSSACGEIVQFGDLNYRENKEISMRIYCNHIKKEDLDRIDGIGIIIGSAVHHTRVDEDKKKEIGENYRPEVEYEEECGGAVKIGSITMAIDKNKEMESEDAITVMLDQAYQRRAEEVDLRLRTNSPYCHVYDDAVTALYRDEQGDEIARDITIRDGHNTRKVGIEQLVAEDRFGLYAKKRSIVSGTINQVDLSPLSRLHKLSTDDERTYVLTSQVANLLDDSSEITLEEIHRPQPIEVEWQS